MSVSVSKNEGMTVITMTSDPGSSCPLAFQLLGNLCCSPVCAVSQGLRRLLAGTLSALGTVQIMVGLFNIGLGVIHLNESNTFLSWSGAPYWLGGLFIAAGIMSVLGERFPSSCLVFLTTCMNLASGCLALIAIALYSMDLVNEYDGFHVSRSCKSYAPEYGPDSYNRRRYWETTISPEERSLKESLSRKNFEICHNTRNILLVLLGGMDILLIILAVLQLCVTVRACSLSMKALCENRGEGKPKPEPELYRPLLDEITTNPTV
ncbi:transmembrane protein 176B-like [Megalops cyprinoides]|uniref:transmembrane protein 176B-like n=1 Tax=Megalops cyprinoides TaxID=118141 RepID=UPI001864AA67|nr:transmembrane protein 176B-like [Megalops cyprinoides]XP_036393738.1 transmembrane protein 176B-like [Megalops cyprinoides]